MGSKGRLQPHLRWPIPAPDMMHPDSFIPGIRPQRGPFFDMLPPSEIMEQKLASQHGEMQKLAHENQRLAASHMTLRQELAAAQQELQRLQTQLSVTKAEKDQQMKSLLDKITKMEVDLQAAESVKTELQKAHSETQNLAAVREELISKVQHLTQELRLCHADVQQIPAMMSELNALKREYHDCRATYEYERKLYSDHLETLQVMERNYISMSMEVQKLRSELANSSNPDKRGGGQYVANSVYSESDTLAQNATVQNLPAQHPAGQNTDSYNVSQGRAPPSGGAVSYNENTGGIAPSRMMYDAPRGTGFEVSRAANYDSSRGGPYDSSRGGASYDGSRGPAAGYDASRAMGAGYDASRVAGMGYDISRGSAAGYDSFRGAAYDAPRTSAYDISRGVALGYDGTRTPSYDPPRGASGYDARGPSGPHTVVPPAANPSYASTPTPTRTGEQPQGVNAVRR